MIHTRGTPERSAAVRALVDRESVDEHPSSGLPFPVVRWVDARALLFGVLTTMGSLLSIAVRNDLALGVGVATVAAAFIVTTAVGALAAAASSAVALSLAGRAGLPAKGRVAARYGRSVWVAALLASAFVLRAVFTDRIERWTLVAAVAGFVIVAALGIAVVDARRRRPS